MCELMYRMLDWRVYVCYRVYWKWMIWQNLVWCDILYSRQILLRTTVLNGQKYQHRKRQPFFAHNLHSSINTHTLAHKIVVNRHFFLKSKLNIQMIIWNGEFEADWSTCGLHQFRYCSFFSMVSPTATNFLAAMWTSLDILSLNLCAHQVNVKALRPENHVNKNNW